jgi:hypothetical protein
MSYSTPFDLRYTSTTFDETLLGFEREFKVLDFVTDSLHPPFKNSAVCRAIFVVNKSNGTLAKGSNVLPNTEAAYPFPMATAGVAGAVDGVGWVSPWISAATVADNACFWLITHGLTRIPYSGSGTVNVGTQLESASTGRATALSSGEKIGWAHEAEAGSAGDLFWAYIDRLGT